MSLLRRRMMMQGKPGGFEYVYDSENGGLLTDDFFTSSDGNGSASRVTFSNVDGVLNANVGSGVASKYIYSSDHENAGNCSIEADVAYNNSNFYIYLCDDSLYACCIVNKFERRIEFYYSDNGTNKTINKPTTANTYYNIKLVKEGSKCSLYVDGVAVAENLDCRTIPGDHATGGKTALRFAFAGNYGASERGVIYVKRIEYREW